MIKPEYSNISSVLLPYPKGFKDSTGDLNRFFINLIGIIPDSIYQFIIVNNKEAEKEIKWLHPSKNIKTVLVENFHEIWLRDIIGFNTGSNRIFKPMFNPDYCNYIYTKDYLEKINEQVKEIIDKSVKYEIVEIPIILDGGNFVSNGEIAFVTDKVIKDNPSNSEFVKDILFDYLGVRTIIIDSNKNDKLSHADGYLNFLDKKRICLSKYPQIDFLKDDIQYVNDLETVLEKNSLDIISIFDRPVDEKVVGGGNTPNDKSKDCLNSARGIYVNFLILNDTIILPEYSIPHYKKHMEYNIVNKRILTDLGYNVLSINCDSIGKLGGSIHCCSFTN